MSPTSRAQDAVRILLIISVAAKPLPSPVADPALPDAVAVLESQVLLQKLDFWVRNPDFLADELLNEYEEGGDFAFLELAGDILASDEPEVRRYPMMRFLFGAYEPLDDALAVLRSAHLVVRRKRGTVGGRVQRHDYYLTRAGRSAAERSCTTFRSSGTSSIAPGWWPAWLPAIAAASLRSGSTSRTNIATR